MRKNLEKAHELLMERIPGDISYTLRGLSQVIIVNNQVSGLFVVAALYVGGGALLGTLSLVCTFVATALARRLFVDVDSVKNGLAGYNACLVGCAFPVFVQQEWGAASFFAGIFCAVVASIMNLALVPSGIPTFTFAFNFTIITYVLFAFESPGPLPDIPPTAWNVIISPIKGVSQIWVVNSALSGFLILIGVAIDSLGIACYALGGSIVGCVTGYVFGGDDALLKTLNGIYGFNSCLMACAIAVFYVPSLVSVCFGIVACIFTELLTLGLGQLFDRTIQSPTFTLPFCIVATACHLILSDGSLKGLHGAISPTSPESNFYQHKARLEEEETLGQSDTSSELRRPTMHVFYGPSAVAVAPKLVNIIDRRPRTAQLELVEESFSHCGSRSRPHEKSCRFLPKHDMDDDEVNASITRMQSFGGLPGASNLGSSTLRRLSRELHGASNLARSTPGSLSGLTEESTDIPDVKSASNLEKVDDTSTEPTPDRRVSWTQDRA